VCPADAVEAPDMNDLASAIRQLRQAPGFAAAAILTLALGIGANTTMFSVVDAVLLRTLPYDEPGRLVMAFEAGKPGQRNAVSAGVFRDWERGARSFEGLAAVADASVNLTGDGDPERITGLRLSPGGLALFRARPLAGRIFAADEDQPGKSRVVILTEGLWRRRFGGDEALVGRDVRLNGEPHTVVGVLPRAFFPWPEPDFVLPLVFEPDQKEQRGSHWLRVVGRLGPGATVAEGEQDLRAVTDSVRPLLPAWKKEWSVTLVPLDEQIAGDVRPILLVLMGAVGLVLLIACANVASLMLTRAQAREKEIAVRLAIGASRGRVVRQFLVECLLLALVGTGLGILLAFAGTAAIRQTAEASLPRAAAIEVDGRVLGFATALSLLTSLVFGLVPAIQASRPHLAGALKDASRSVTGGKSRTRSVLIVSEVALALVLLAGAGLLLRSFGRLLDVPAGFEPRQALSLRLSLADAKYPDDERRTAAIDRILDAVAALPGVEAVGTAGALPLTGAPDTLVRIPGKEGPQGGAYSTDFDRVAPGYFAALRVPLRRGRLFDAHDAAARRRVIVVNETFAKTHFPGEEPIGKVIGDANHEWEIVGVVGDVRHRGLANRIRPTLYRPHVFGAFVNRILVVRTTPPPRALIEPIQQAILAIDPDLPVSNAKSLEEVAADSVAQRRLVLNVLGLFAGVALLLAGIGLYGVVAYSVSQRTREIGVRLAVGAGRRDVLALFVAQGTRLAGLGVVLGLCAGLGLTRLLASQLYGVEPTDPVTLATVSVLLLAVATAASLLPARRATKVDPVHALR
jgi:predicted permease